MGSKARIAKYILPIILKDRKPGQWYVEPFCGGLNLLRGVDGNRIVSDVHNDLCAFYIAIQNGWQPPKYINEDDYNRIKKISKDPVLRGYVGFLFSFGAKYMDTYRRQGGNRIAKAKKDKTLIGVELKNNYGSMDYTNKLAKDWVCELFNLLKGVHVVCSDYSNLKIPPKSIIYCDPPYLGTTQFKGAPVFGYNKFYDWCRFKAAQGHRVFVSEYNMPKDFKTVWQKGIKVYLNNSGQAKAGDRVEKLFTL